MTIGNKSINEYYIAECRSTSDINQHLPILLELANECETVTELGLRWVVSTWAFLNSNAKKITSIDICDPSEFKHLPEYHRHSPSDIETINQLAQSVNKKYIFIKANTLKIEIEPTDLLFIDTLHYYYQLHKELLLHSNKTTKYIAIHDVETFKYKDEVLKNNPVPTTEHIGLKKAIDHFLDVNNCWTIKQWYDNNNGLCILERKT